jgi:hypothetical protein
MPACAGMTAGKVRALPDILPSRQLRFPEISRALRPAEPVVD